MKRTTERHSGKGAIYKDGVKVIDCEYDVFADQEFTEELAHTVPQPVGKCRWHIRLYRAYDVPLGVPLVLRLEDGRGMRFHVKNSTEAVADGQPVHWKSV